MVTFRQKRNFSSIAIALILAVVICVAFIVGYVSVYKSTRDNLIHSTQDKLTIIADSTTAFLQKAKTVVGTDAGTIDHYMENGSSNADILAFLRYQTAEELEEIDGRFSSVYGYYRGEYLDGSDWVPETGYQPTERPWYTAAVEKAGEVAIASPYFDLDTKDIVLSITKLLSDGESVVGLDVNLVGLSGYISQYLARDVFDYAYIIDNTGIIVGSMTDSESDDERKTDSETGKNYLGEDAESDTLGLAGLFRRTLDSDEIFYYEIGGKNRMVISKTIENGWKVVALTEEGTVLTPLNRIAGVCIGLLVLLIGVLAYFAARSIRDSKRSEAAQEKEKRYVNELMDYYDQLSNYKRAVLSDALISLEVNLSRDDLYYGVWKDDEGNEVPLPDILGMKTPCSYDEYIEKWNKRFVKADLSDSFSTSTDREYLLSAFDGGDTEVTFDYEAKTISGRSTWLRRSISMTRNQMGDVVAYTSVKDISALVEQSKREEDFVRALATEYDSITVISLHPDKDDDEVVIHSRLSGNIAAIVDEETAAEKKFSRKLDGLVKYVHPEDRKRFVEETKREKVMGAFDRGETAIVNFRLMKPDGSDLFYQIRFVPIRDDGGTPTGCIAVLRDINNEIQKELGVRRELEDAKIAAEAANQAKSTFLFNMSHDIRTPMNAIIGFTDMAEKHIDERERVLDSLGKVKSASDHLLSLINDVLDMSRVEAGRVKIEEEPIMLDTMKDNIYSLLAGSAKEKEIVINATVDPSVVHHWVWGDRLRLMRVLTNIVSNSVKYTNPGGKIDFLLEELPCETEGRVRMRYVTTDTGIGMSEEFLAHIFEPFSRAESATRSGVTGTGLGMAITRSLVELMGGTIEIESTPGVGTTVRVELEHRIADPVDPAAGIRKEDAPDLNGKKVLLVEDNELNREIAVEILEAEGVTVDTAEDGDIAVDKMAKAEAGQYDLILMDVQMPRMNGYDATRAIRALPDPWASSIPIVAMTANAFAEDKQNAFAAGMNGHIAKPIDVAKLIGTLEEVLKTAAGKTERN